MKALILILTGITLITAETLVSGKISKNAWWTADKNPYVVTNDILIEKNARLVIDPGVEILIEKPLKIPSDIPQLSSADTFGITFRVEGALRCNGKPDNPIVFRGRYMSEGEEYAHWEGLVINTSRSNEVALSYTFIHNAANGITVSKGVPMIRNSLFERNHIGIRTENGSSPRIVNNLFTDNFFAAIRVENANPEIFNSIFYKNRNFGIYCDRLSKIQVWNNGFYSHGDRPIVGGSPQLLKLTKTNRNGDSTDFCGNLMLDPVFVGSPAESKLIQSKIKKLHQSSLQAPSQKEISEIKSPTKFSENRRYYLSKHSPYRDAGNASARFKEPDGSLPDLGIWGGAEFLQF